MTLAIVFLGVWVATLIFLRTFQRRLSKLTGPWIHK